MTRPDTQLSILSQEEIQLDRCVQQNRVGSLQAAPATQVARSSSALTAEQRPCWYPQEGEAFGTELRHLDWIDQFVANVRPYIRVRLEDGVLIKMPMEVFQINRTGLRAS